MTLRNKKPFYKTKIFYIVAPILCVVLLAGVLEATNVINVFRTSQPVVSGGQETKGEPRMVPGQQSGASNSNSSTSKPDTSQPGDEKSNQGGSAQVKLLAPSGNFVSNHRPNLSGSPAPNDEVSTCTTTPGASCTITFTNSEGIKKSLPAQTTDRGGSAYWNWKLQDYGLTVGSWKVQAISTLGGQSETVVDPLALEVSP